MSNLQYAFSSSAVFKQVIPVYDIKVACIVIHNFLDIFFLSSLVFLSCIIGTFDKSSPRFFRASLPTAMSDF